MSEITTTKALTKADLDKWAPHAGWIRGHLCMVAHEIIAAGKHLIVVKAGLDHGKFLEWINRELDMSDRQARRLMRAAAWAESKSDTVSELPPSVLYLLASPSTPPEVTDDVIARAEEGHRIKAAEVKLQIKRSQVAPAAGANSDIGNAEEIIPADQVDAVIEEPEIIPPPRKSKTPRKPTRAQLERHEAEAEQAAKRAEVVAILRKLDRADLKQLAELEGSWLNTTFVYSVEWFWVLVELDPGQDWSGQIEDSDLDTEENRQRLADLKKSQKARLPWAPGATQ